MKLSEEQVEAIRTFLQQNDIQIPSLQEDILDHLCCALEDTKELNTSFEERLREAAHDLAPYGLDKLQRETVFLLNSKKLIYMKYP